MRRCSVEPEEDAPRFQMEPKKETRSKSLAEPNDFVMPPGWVAGLGEVAFVDF